VIYIDVTMNNYYTDNIKWHTFTNCECGVGNIV
jgi:hypothetical protein